MRQLLQTLFFFLLVAQICTAQSYWTQIDSMPEIRLAHTANELNGKIYIVGGANTEQSPDLTTMLVYDRAETTWTTIPLLNNEFRVQHTSSVVDSKLYVIGGWTTDGSNYVTSSKVDMYDPNTGLWTSKNPMPTDRANLASALIDGKIYVMGGLKTLDFTGLKKLEVYDVASDTWDTTKADMPTKRWGHSAVAINGKIYVIGGTTITPNFAYASVEVYDPQNDTWTTKSNMPTPRYQLTTSVLNNNIYAIDGWLDSGNGPIYDKVEVYNPESDTWNTETPMPVARAMLASIVLDGKIQVFGGSYTTHPLIGSSDIYEFTSLIVPVEVEVSEPLEFALEQNFPNPFNPITSIQYAISSRQFVKLTVFDLLGREIETLVNEEKPAGTYKINWYAEGLPSGVYFYQLKAGNFIETKKMLLLK